MITTILTFIQSEGFISAGKILLGGIGGVLLNQIWMGYKNKVQKMQCHYLEDDILSKLPIKTDNITHTNIHCKRFEVINTTNRDILEFQLFFQFDSTAEVLECYSRSKEGYNRQRIKVNRTNKNEAVAIVKNFNRGDKIEYVFKIANISDNKYYVTESSCIGFKIKCKDKRKLANKSKSNRSDQILIEKQ